MSNTVTVTDESFDADVLNNDKVVIVDFWATWCTPCRVIAPVLEEIAEEYDDKVVVAKVDIDQNPKMPQRYNVMSIPTLIVFSKGDPVKQIVGVKPKSSLLSSLADYLR